MFEMSTFERKFDIDIRNFTYIQVDPHGQLDQGSSAFPEFMFKGEYIV